ncbi:MAG: glycosyltransferase family 39 protein [Opitutales bacterium]|nr:glycosyltransferase family 39 protein [Opitutales bacterium]
MKKILSIILCAALALAFFAGLSQSAGMRLKNAESRAVHADEGEQTFTFAKLYQNNDYKYNPGGPHGPILYYWAAVFLPKEKAQTFDVPDVRKTLFPIFYLSVFSLLLLGFEAKNANLKKSRLPQAAAGAFAAIALMFSSLSLIYSTYFVQEAFFALFALWCAAAFYKLAQARSLFWALAFGISAGLMQSAKETSIIVFAGIFAGFAAVLISQKKAENSRLVSEIKALGALKIAGLCAAALLSAFCVYAVFYSSFFTNWQGVLDGVKSYAHFFQKSGSVAHTKDYLYYIKLLAGFKSQNIIFGETAIFALGILGSVLAFAKKNAFIKYMSGFAWANILVLSFIGYKTPWLLLAPITALCLCAGYAASEILFAEFPRLPRAANAAIKIALLALLCAAFKFQYKEAQNASVKYTSDPRNPFLYVHTVKPEERLVRRIKECAKAAGADFKVLVLTKNSPWPLPWQLIRIDGVKFSRDAAEAKSAAQNTIVVFDEYFDDALSGKFGEKEWVEEIFGLRENLPLKVFTRRDVFDKSIEN